MLVFNHRAYRLMFNHSGNMLIFNHNAYMLMFNYFAYVLMFKGCPETREINRKVCVRVWYNISIVFPYVYKWLYLLSGGKCFNDKLFCFGTRRKSTSSQLGLSKPTLGREMGNEKWDWDKSRGQDQWRQNGREAEGKDDRETIEKSRQRRVMGGYTNIISCSRHWLQK